MEREGKGNTKNSIGAGYRRAMLREADPKKIADLELLYQKALAEFNKTPASAAKYLGGDLAKDNSKKLSSKAAYMLVANALLNLDEFLTKS
ncbi:hypothetical protein D3C86_958670 [compost metagenome]